MGRYRSSITLPPPFLSFTNDSHNERLWELLLNCTITVNFQAPYASNLEDVKKIVFRILYWGFQWFVASFYSQRLLCIYWRGIRKLCTCIRNTFLYFLYYLKENYIECFISLISLGISKFFVSKEDRVIVNYCIDIF